MTGHAPSHAVYDKKQAAETYQRKCAQFGPKIAAREAAEDVFFYELEMIQGSPLIKVKGQIVDGEVKFGTSSLKDLVKTLDADRANQLLAVEKLHVNNVIRFSFVISSYEQDRGGQADPNDTNGASWIYAWRRVSKTEIETVAIKAPANHKELGKFLEGLTGRPPNATEGVNGARGYSYSTFVNEINFINNLKNYGQKNPDSQFKSLFEKIAQADKRPPAEAEKRITEITTEIETLESKIGFEAALEETLRIVKEVFADKEDKNPLDTILAKLKKLNEQITLAPDQSNQKQIEPNYSNPDASSRRDLLLGALRDVIEEVVELSGQSPNGKQEKVEVISEGKAEIEPAGAQASKPDLSKSPATDAARQIDSAPPLFAKKLTNESLSPITLPSNFFNPHHRPNILSVENTALGPPLSSKSSTRSGDTWSSAERLTELKANQNSSPLPLVSVNSSNASHESRTQRIDASRQRKIQTLSSVHMAPFNPGALVQKFDLITKAGLAKNILMLKKAFLAKSSGLQKFFARLLSKIQLALPAKILVRRLQRKIQKLATKVRNSSSLLKEQVRVMLNRVKRLMLRLSTIRLENLEARSAIRGSTPFRLLRKAASLLQEIRNRMVAKRPNRYKNTSFDSTRKYGRPTGAWRKFRDKPLNFLKNTPSRLNRSVKSRMVARVATRPLGKKIQSLLNFRVDRRSATLASRNLRLRKTNSLVRKVETAKLTKSAVSRRLINPLTALKLLRKKLPKTRVSKSFNRRTISLKARKQVKGPKAKKLLRLKRPLRKSKASRLTHLEHEEFLLWLTNIKAKSKIDQDFARANKKRILRGLGRKISHDGMKSTKILANPLCKETRNFILSSDNAPVIRK